MFSNIKVTKIERSAFFFRTPGIGTVVKGLTALPKFTLAIDLQYSNIFKQKA